MTPKAILILLFIELLIIYIIMSYKIYKLKEQHLKTLQQLIDKATPKRTNKISDDTYEYYFCPRCESQVIENIVYYTEWEGDTTLHIVYCPSCGQALKWKD